MARCSLGARLAIGLQPASGRASELRATYQIRLLIYMAVEQGKKLVIEVRKDCKIHESLRELAKQYSKNVKIERVKIERE